MSKVLLQKLNVSEYDFAVYAAIEDDDPFDGKDVVEVEFKSSKKPSQSMRALFRVWMAETAKFMADNGVTMPLYHRANGEACGIRPFDKNDAYELFMRTWGGLDDNGERVSSSDKSGDKGRMLHIMDSHLAWAVEKGLSLTVPRDCEYDRLDRERNS